MTATTDERFLEILTHMLGADPSRAPILHGYRNHFCAEVDAEDHRTLLEMQQAGLVVAGAKINEDRDQYFHATRAGCDAAGLNESATKRALGEA